MSEPNAAAPRADRRSRRMLVATIPPPILRGIEGAAKGEVERAVARLLFLADATERGDHVRQARMEHAIARALLDAWSSGIGSAEAVGSAYAAVASRVVIESRGRLDDSKGDG